VSAQGRSRKALTRGGNAGAHLLAEAPDSGRDDVQLALLREELGRRRVGTADRQHVREEPERCLLVPRGLGEAVEQPPGLDPIGIRQRAHGLDELLRFIDAEAVTAGRDTVEEPCGPALERVSDD
jgi:hypothetical protein